jgi:FG-GAP-like repeat
MMKRHTLAAAALTALLLAGAAPASALDFEEPAPPLSPIGGVGIASGLALGDFDRDGVQDMAVGDNGVGQVITILRGTGGGAFVVAATVPAPTTPSDIEAADFNGDGDLDLAVASILGHTISIFAGLAGANFIAAGAYPTGVGPVELEIADVTGEGSLDLVVAQQGRQNDSSPREAVAVFAGSGLAFGQRTEYLAGNSPRDIAIADFNGDGLRDIAVANRESRNVSILLRSAGGSFISAATIPIAGEPHCIEDARVDSDATQDLMVCDNQNGVMHFLRGNGSGGFSAAGTIGVGAINPDKAVLRDFDADGDADLAVAAFAGGAVSLFEHTGATLVRRRVVPIGRGASRLRSGDLDGDGAPDLAMTIPGLQLVRVLLNTAAPPQTTLTATPAPLSRDATPEFRFTANERFSSFECRVGSAPFAGCASPRVLAALPDGTHRFDVRAVDPSRVPDPSPASFLFTLDTTPPDSAIGAGPGAYTSDATPTFAISSPDAGAALRCRLDAQPFAACPGSSFTASPPLADGPHAFALMAVDAAGNEDPSPATRSFVVDTLAPQTTIASGPPDVSGTGVAFALASDEPQAQFECALDGAGFLPCASRYELGALGGGDHTLLVRARDPAGNVDGTPARRTWTVDTTPPETSILDGPTGVVQDDTPAFAFAADEPASTFECSLGDAAFQPCTSPHEPASLTDGDHLFRVRARDARGNVDPSAAERAFGVRRPSSPSMPGPSGPTRDASPPRILGLRAVPRRFRGRTVIRLTVSEAGRANLVLRRKVGRRLRMVGAYALDVEAGRTRLPVVRGRLGALRLLPGLHVLTVSVRDAAGNRSARRSLRLQVLQPRGVRHLRGGSKRHALPPP